MLYYFAYGSNLYLPRMQGRVPSAEVVGNALLREHDLRFHMLGSDETGKCDAFHTEEPDHYIWGVVYKIKKEERIHLDHAESLGTGYEIKHVDVEIEGQSLNVFTYYALRIQENLRPTQEYYDYVHGGALHHQFPEDYLEHIHLKAWK
jgi:gamma-glutamylcyclotransferase